MIGHTWPASLGLVSGTVENKKPFLVGNSQTQSLHVPECSFAPSPKSLLVEPSLRDDEDVVGKRAGNALKLPHLVDPRHQQKGDPGHAKWATLGYAAEMAVGFAKRASHTVMVNQGSMEATVSSDNLGGQPPAQSKSRRGSKGI